MEKKPRGRRPKAKGLGDSIEKVTEATGIKKVVEKVSETLGVDCGCDQRKEWLNSIFPYRKPNCPNEADTAYLSDYFASKRTNVSREEQIALGGIYERVFNKKWRFTNCASCLRGMIADLKAVYDGERV